MSYFDPIIQVVFVALAAPYLLGLMIQVRSILEGRQGSGVSQVWRDLRKNFRKNTITPDGTTVFFSWAPYVYFGTALLVSTITPIVVSSLIGDPYADLFAIVGILLLGTVSLVLAGLDTGTAFGGMGASREMTILALVEPTILMSVYAVSIPMHSSNLGVIVEGLTRHPFQAVSPGNALAMVALVIVILAETSRLPIDNPHTHLELTMIHEAMILEYSGSRLALMEWAASIRLAVFLSLLANLSLPFEIASPGGSLLRSVVGLVAISLKVGLLGVAIASAEVFVAKLRLFRVPELLAGSFVISVLAVAGSFMFSIGLK